MESACCRSRLAGRFIHSRQIRATLTRGRLTFPLSAPATGGADASPVQSNNM